MRRLPVENVEDGMVLAKDVCASSGNILVGKGAELSSSLARRLKNWGITLVYIEGEENSGSEEVKTNVSPEEIKTRLEKKFSEAIDDYKMKKIFDEVLEYRLNNKM